MLKPTMSPSIVLVRRSLSTGARSRPKTLRNGFNSIVLPCSSTFFSLFGAKASKSISSTSITNYGTENKQRVHGRCSEREGACSGR
jgi:hypothetical protein